MVTILPISRKESSLTIKSGRSLSPILFIIRKKNFKTKFSLSCTIIILLALDLMTYDLTTNGKLLWQALFLYITATPIKHVQAFLYRPPAWPKSKSALIPWDTGVIIVNPPNEHMEKILRSIFTQRDIIWSFSLSMFYLPELYVLYRNKSFIRYLWKSLDFSVPPKKESTMECTIKYSFCFTLTFYYLLWLSTTK